MCALCFLASPAAAESINIRVSVKFICNASNQPPSTGSDIDYTDPLVWQAMIDQANARFALYGRGYRYLYPDEYLNVLGASQYFNLEDSEFPQIEIDARNPNNVQQYHWREDAVNVYVTQTNGGTISDPGCAGWAAIPSKDAMPNGDHRRIVVFCVSTIAPMAHELGHHFNLHHTWAANHAPETPTDADPFQCYNQSPYCNVCVGANPPCNGGLNEPVECCCTTKANLTVAQGNQQGWSPATLSLMLNNIMSYHCDVLPDFEQSDGQWDRYGDAIKEFHRNETTGEPVFVRGGWQGASNGYSAFPYKTVVAGAAAANDAGGDIVLIRTGFYNETPTINMPMTLRADRGMVTIGLAGGGIAGGPPDDPASPADDERRRREIIADALKRAESAAPFDCAVDDSQPRTDPPRDPVDFNADGVVDALDLMELLSRMGGDDRRADLNADGVVDSADLAALLNAWRY